MADGSTIPTTRFTVTDLAAANENWGCNCGPGALAAVLGLTLDEVRPHMGDFEQKGYTNPTLMIASVSRAIDAFGGNYSFHTPSKAEPTIDWPRFGLARIQWEGPWTAPGVPLRVRYRHTHWVGASARSLANVGIFDINALSDANPSGWTPLEAWAGILVPHILEQCVPRANGRWHITHTIEIERYHG